jgi:hypothetical protein
MDELESLGVIDKPEDHNVQVECVSLSFLITKPDGGYRLVTNFSPIASFIRPPPSRVSSTDNILTFLAKWKYIIKSDMTNQFFQLPLDRDSMRYAGILTPYKGIRIYLRAAMVMSGSSEHLDELVFSMLGPLIHEGVTNKIADDLYVGGNSTDELLCNWERTLDVFKKNNLRLKASKTVMKREPITVVTMRTRGPCDRKLYRELETTCERIATCNTSTYRFQTLRAGCTKHAKGQYSNSHG